MTRQEATEVLENGEWWDMTMDIPCDSDAAIKFHDAVDMAIAALHAQPGHVKLDRSRWDGCEWCRCRFAEYPVKPCGNGDLRARAEYVLDESGPGVVLLVDLHRASGYFDIAYCPHCGRPLTEEAWVELERRIGGNDGEAD